MTVNRTTLLDLPLPVSGTESGTWGDTTNNGLTQYMDIAIAGMSNLTSANFAAGALTIETTEGTSSATNITATSAQYAGFRVTSLATNSTITVGNTGTSPARSYRLINADSTYTLTFKATGQTGVTLQPGQSAVVAFNGTDYVFIGAVGPGSSLNTPLAVVGNATAGAEIRLPEDTDNGSNYVALKAPDTLASNLTFTLPSADGSAGQVITTNGSGTLSFGTLGVAGGGTGATTLTANNVILGNGTSAVQFVAPGSNGNVLTSNGTTWASSAPAAGGFSNMAVLTSGTSWTAPSGVTKIKVYVTGGGGGGGGARNVEGAIGGTGGAGGTAIKIFNVTAGSSYTYAIGSGGSAGTTAPTNGSAGGSSTFTVGATTVTGGGGGGGPAGNPGAGSGASGGVGTNGDLNVTGQGGSGSFDGLSIYYYGSSFGGNSFWGGGASGGPSASTGNAATNYGGGGSGGNSSGGARAGGAGFQGVIVIEY